MLGLMLVLMLAASACTTATTIDDGAQGAPSSAPTTAPTVAQVEPTAVPLVATPTATLPPVPSATADPTATSLPTATSVPTATAVPTPVPRADTDHSGLAGQRGLTVQWISWEPEDWGTIEFVPLVDGTYAVNGTQQGPDADFVTVDGTIVRITDRELLFTGTVTVQVSYNNNGQPCERTGDIAFLATGNRQFWRMQDLLNCDGIVTDYVDIYFG